MNIRLYPDWPNPKESDAATGKTMLEALANGRVLRITKTENGDGFRIQEMCNEFFNLFLTPNQLLALSGELRFMAIEAIEKARPHRFPTPHQIAECGGPCEEGGPDACDCGLRDRHRAHQG